MTYQIPTSEPTELRAGLSWQWDRSLGDFPASGWTLKYRFRGPGLIPVVTAGSSGDTHQVRVTASTSASYAAGTYEVVGWVTDGTDAHEVYHGSVYVAPALTSESAEQAHDEKVLAQIDAVLEGRTTADTQFIQIGGRSISQIPIPDLLRLQNVYRARVARLRNGGQAIRRHGVRFGG